MAFSAEYVYRILDQYSGPLARITRATERFREATARAQEQARRVGTGMRDAGAKMTAGLTLPIAGLGIAAAKTAIDFQNAFIGVQKTVEATPKQLAVMNEQFKRMSTIMPVSATDLMKIGESAGQLGIETKNITSFTRTIAMLGATTNLTGEAGATQLARFANITQMSQNEFDRLGSTIVALGNNLATTEAEIVAMGMRLAGAGNVVGLTEAQIMAISGTLTSLGINAEAGGTAFSKVMMDINDAVGKGGPMLNMFAKVSDMTAKQFATSFKKDASTGILAFVEGLSRLQKEGKNVNVILEALEMSDIRVRDALLRASGSGDLFRKAMLLGNDAWRKNNALKKEASLRFGSWASKLSIVLNKLKLMVDEIGQVLVPIMLFFIDYAIMPLVKLFSILPKPIKAVIVVLGGLVAVIGPLLLAMGFLIPAFTTLGTTVLPYIAATILPWLVSSLTAVGAALAALTWPVWALIAAGAALIGTLILAWNKSIMFRASVANLMDAISPLTDGIKQIVFWIGSSLSKALGSSVGEVASWADAFRVVGDVISVVIDFIAAMIKTVFDAVGAIGKIAGAISMGNWRDALSLITTGKSSLDIGAGVAREKAGARQDNKIEVSGSIGVSATGGAKVERAEIGLNTGSNLAVAH